MACKVADGEIEALVKDFLGSIATFQEKLKVGVAPEQNTKIPSQLNSRTGQ